MFTVTSPDLVDYEQTYDTLPQAVRGILNLPRRSAQLENETTGQMVRVRALRDRNEVIHIVHPDSPFYENEAPEYSLGSVVRYNERPFLRMVANQVKRFLRGQSVSIFDSNNIITKI